MPLAAPVGVSQTHRPQQNLASSGCSHSTGVGAWGRSLPPALASDQMVFVRALFRMVRMRPLLACAGRRGPWPALHAAHAPKAHAACAHLVSRARTLRCAALMYECGELLVRLCPGNCIERQVNPDLLHLPGGSRAVR